MERVNSAPFSQSCSRKEISPLFSSSNFAHSGADDHLIAHSTTHCSEAHKDFVVQLQNWSGTLIFHESPLVIHAESQSVCIELTNRQQGRKSFHSVSTEASEIKETDYKKRMIIIYRREEN